MPSDGGIVGARPPSSEAEHRPDSTRTIRDANEPREPGVDPATEETLSRARVLLAPRYLPHALMGAGGMGTVVRAHDSTLSRDVAVKLLSEAYRSNSLARARFLREAQACARLRHPNIVAVFDVDAELRFIVMELVDGESLRTLLARRGPLLPEEVRRIGRAVLDALEAAHAAGIVHRDVKPDNVLLDADGNVKLTDFGIAHLEDSKLTQTGAYVGTPAYMAPEQLRGRAVDARTDVYATGATLFEAATAMQLHTEERSIEDPRAALVQHTRDDTLADAVSRAVRERPESRYPSAAEFRRALSESPVARATAAPAAAEAKLAPPPPTLRTTRRRLRVAAISAALALALAAYLGARLVRQESGDETRNAAEHAGIQVALLPFEDSTGLVDAKFGVAGLPNLLAERLGGVPGVTVLGYYKLRGDLPSETVPLAEWAGAARRLGAGLAVAGSLASRSDGGIEIVIRLGPPTSPPTKTWTRVVRGEAVASTVQEIASEIASEALGRRVELDKRHHEAEVERMLVLGKYELEASHLREAMTLLEAAARLDPASGEVHYHLAVVGWWLGEPKEDTEARISRALELPQPPSRSTFLEGLAVLLRRDYAASTIHFRAASARFPRDRDILYGLFESQFHGGRPAEAIATYREIVALHPELRLGVLHALTHAIVQGDSAAMDWALDHARVGEHRADAAWGPRILIARGKRVEAREQLERLVETGGTGGALDVGTAGIQDTLAGEHAVAGNVDVALAMLKRLSHTLGRAPMMCALEIARGADREARGWRDGAVRGLTAKEPVLRMTVWPALVTIDVVGGDRRALEEIEAMRNAIAPEQPGDPRTAMLRLLLDVALARRAAVTSALDSPFPEVALAAQGARAELDGEPAAAARAWELATTHSGDGEFVLVEHWFAARQHRLAGDHAGVIRACMAAAEPRLFHSSWGAVAGRCLAWSAEAHEALGNTGEARALAERLVRMRSAAPANDRLVVTARRILALR